MTGPFVKSEAVPLTQCNTCPYSDNPAPDTTLSENAVVDVPFPPAKCQITTPHSSQPGRILKQRFARFGATAGINCNILAARMNAWGPQGCRNHLPEIVHDIFPRARHAIDHNTDIDQNKLTIIQQAGLALIKLLSHSQHTRWLADYLIRAVILGEVYQAIREAERPTPTTP